MDRKPVKIRRWVDNQILNLKERSEIEFNDLERNWPNNWIAIPCAIESVANQYFSDLKATECSEKLMNKIEGVWVALTKLAVGLVYNHERKGFDSNRYSKEENGEPTGIDEQVQDLYNASISKKMHLGRIRQMVRTVSERIKKSPDLPVTLETRVALLNSELSNEKVKLINVRRLIKEIYVQYFYIHNTRITHSLELGHGYKRLKSIIEKPELEKTLIRKLLLELKTLGFTMSWINEDNLWDRLRLAMESNSELPEYKEKIPGVYRGGRPRKESAKR